MYRRYIGPPDQRCSVCIVEAVLDTCFTEIVFCGLMFSLWLHLFLTHSTLERMEIVKKKGGWPVFVTDILNTFFCQLLKSLPSSRVKLIRI